MELVPYRRRHLKTFKPGVFDTASTRLLADIPAWEGKAVSAVRDGRTLGVCGIAVTGETAQVWAVLSDELRARPVTLCRLAQGALKRIHCLHGVRQIDVTVDPGFTAARHWIGWLGFVRTEQGIDFERYIYGEYNKNSTTFGRFGRSSHRCDPAGESGQRRG